MDVQEDEVYASSQPSKKIKIQPAFYLIDKKIIAFCKIDQSSILNMVLTDIAESISKPAHISEYEINQSSLIRAKSLGYSSKRVIDFFIKYSKNTVGTQLINYVSQVFQTLAATRLFLLEQKQKNFYVFEHPKEFQRDYTIDSLLVRKLPAYTTEQLSRGESSIQKQTLNFERWEVASLKHNQLFKILFQRKVPVLSEKVLEKRQLAQELRTNGDLFRNRALHCKNLKINLKAFTKLRDYQSEALKAVVYHSLETNNRIVKSGYIVLPCGAGKTLLGIAICAKIKKETLIVCSSDSGADQWKRQIQKWTQGISREQIITLTAKTDSHYTFKAKDSAKIFISTYSNLKAKLEVRDREGQAKRDIKVEHQWLRMMPWGLIVFDEAQWLPAPGNSQIANSLMAHVKIGLTATPLREDDNIQALIFMIGPRLYEGSWRKFVENGYLANPKCVEIRTKLTGPFQRIFNQNIGKQKDQLSIVECNPNKIKTLLLLLEYHEALNDQIIVFCDRISIIYFLAKKLKKPLLTGDTSIEDRNFVFDMFREGKYKTVFLSRIGDQAIDLPNATVGIEINIHKGSRRQMLQRLGRIMRPKDSNISSTYNAAFYTIVTDDTPQIRYFNKRRQCLINLGFQYDLRFSNYGQQRMADIFGKQSKEVTNALKIYEQIMRDISEEKFYNIMKFGDQNGELDSFQIYNQSTKDNSKFHKARK